VPNREVSIEVDLAKNARGELAGTFSNPARNLKGFPLASVTVEGNAIRLLIKANSGGGTFEGVLSGDGRSMSGTFNTTEGGYSIPFGLTRTGDARIEAAATSAPIGKELEGTWHGALVANGKQVRLVLTLSNHPDGTGSILQVDEGLDVPIATITQKASSLTLDITAVGGSYSGTLNADGTELAGTWNEGQVSLPLTFRRAAEGKQRP
jgi:hypothetical protein